LFNPTEYFGGLEIQELGEEVPDRRLDDMFQEYLSTEENEQGIVRFKLLNI
jgi:hypothetical protein